MCLSAFRVLIPPGPDKARGRGLNWPQNLPYWTGGDFENITSLIILIQITMWTWIKQKVYNQNIYLAHQYGLSTALHVTQHQSFMIFILDLTWGILSFWKCSSTDHLDTHQNVNWNWEISIFKTFNWFQLEHKNWWTCTRGYWSSRVYFFLDL